MSDYDEQQLGVRANSDSVAAGDNNAGLTVVLTTHGRHIVNASWDLGSSATVKLEGRNPKGLNEWETIAEYDTATNQFANADRATEPYNAFEEVRVTTTATGIAIDFEISATR
jgi:hypothetical protein